MKPEDWNIKIPETSSKTPCPDCGQIGAHYCDFPNQRYGYGKSEKLRMTQDQIAEFAKWLRENECVSKSNMDDADDWELFAYRIVSKLGV